MAKGGSRQQRSRREELALNSGNPWPSVKDARAWVLHIQQQLHRWSEADRGKVFEDIFNLVYDRATLVVAWDRVRSNRGSRTAGIDGATRWHIERRGVVPFLEDIRADLKARRYQPLPVREHGIPKGGGKVRYLGSPTIRDRVVQMAIKLILEPIFEVGFYPASYGYRPGRRAQDAIAEIVHFINTPSAYDHVVEGDIKACFDNVHHGVLLQQVRDRVTDRRLLQVVKAFLRAGVMKAGSGFSRSLTGTPQGGIISPLLANIYLTALDRHFERAWQWQTRYIGHTTHLRRKGHATYRLVRYADDFVILVRGSRAQAEAIRDEAAAVLRDELRMELSVEKTLVTHVDEGFDFLGHHVRRVPWAGSRVGWTFPSKKSLAAIRQTVKNLTSRATTFMSLKVLLMRLSPILRGWANYFRYDASKRTFSYVDHYVWWRIARWLRKKHPGRTWEYIQRRYGGWRFSEDGIDLFRVAQVKVERYRFRGQRILLPWMEEGELGEVGPYAGSTFDDPTYLGKLQERLTVS